jgi:lipoprotein-releasing system permease protein
MGRKKGSNASSVLAIVGIAVGVLALTVIISVMNGFQLGFIESILEVSSYHIRVDNFPADKQQLLDNIRGTAGVESVTPFCEAQGILRGQRGGMHVAVIRGLPPDILENDRGLAKQLVFETGSFDIGSRNTILLGSELAARLRVRTGEQIDLLSVSNIVPAAGGGSETSFTVRGTFRTGFYEYDSGWAFINIESAAELNDEHATVSVGVKLGNRWNVERVTRSIAELAAVSAPGNEMRVSSWRDYNKAFFGALRTEKVFMFVLVGLIFIVVALNIFQSQRRIVLERREEIGLLRALGATSFTVRCIFAANGFFIGFAGAVSGMALAVLVSTHINFFFTLLETIVNSAISLINSVAGVFSGGDFAGGGDFAVFSPAIFYIKEIPSRIIPREAVLIFLSGLLSAVLSSWAASLRVSRIKPAEVLRYE